jgi:hypothetical protein
MNDLSELSKHMGAFGMAMLARAVIDSTFAEIERPFAHPLAAVCTPVLICSLLLGTWVPVLAEEGGYNGASPGRPASQ